MPLNPALLLGLTGALSAALMAGLAFAISRAPGWRELRAFAAVGATAALYCLFDVVNAIPVSDTTLFVGERFMLASSFAYGAAWIRYLAALDNRPLRRVERGVMLAAGVMIGLALVPGAMLGPPVNVVPVPWFGVTYRMASPTTFGVVAVVCTAVAVIVAAFSGERRWRDGWQARLPMVGATVIALAALSDTLAALRIISMPQLIEAVTVVVVGAMGVSYLRRFAADATRLEALSTELERQVAVRSEQLVKAQAAIAQQERLVSVGRIAAGVAHEINNPAAVIQHNLDELKSELASRGALSDDASGYIDASRKGIRRIADIVRQLLQTGRPSMEESVARASFLVAPVVERALASATTSASSLVAESVVPESLVARGDPALFEQVLINLLVNAAHATGEVGGGRVQIDGERDQGLVRLYVRDDGPGIPEAIRERLFEPFATTKPIGKGTGLGLAVSRGLMTRQGGALYVGATSASGTEMVVELPEGKTAELVDAAPAAKAAPRREDELPARSIRVLVIDDNEDLRELLAMQLERFFEADTASSVAEAMSLVEKGRTYDVVLCDLMMPDGGAQGWLARCSVVDPRLEDHTVLITGGPTTESAMALVEARRDRVLYKPMELADLRSMIARVASRPPTR